MLRKTAVVLVLMLLSQFAHLAFAQELDKDADERMRRVVKILRTTNKAQVNQFVPVAFEMKHVNPYAVLRFIRRPIEAEEGNWWTFVHPDGNSGRLLINVPIWQVEPMRELVSLIDRPNLTSSSGSVRAYIPLRHRDPRDPGFAGAVLANLTATASYAADAPTGSLFLQDSPSGIDAARAIIESELDKPLQQILLRAKIYEIDLNNDGTIGLDYHAWKNGPGRNLFAFGAFGDYYNRSGDTPDIVGPPVDTTGLPSSRIKSSGYNAAYLYSISSAYFDFLVSKGKARVLTSPRLAVRNTEVAQFSTGEQILYYAVQNGASPRAGIRGADRLLDPTGADPAYPDNRTVAGSVIDRAVPKVADAGVKLAVRPIISENQIDMAITLEAVSQLGFDDSGVPMLATREVATDLRVQPGAEYIIGGMTRTRSIQATQKVPILGSIPVIGYLFGGETTAAQKTMIAMVISASIVEDGSGATKVERDIFEQVETPGMHRISHRNTLVGFDMLGMGD